ncbi:flagella accessory C family protein [Halobaculum sp. WSA2]|uniref:Flagella accessory C family protein n=1 Tax=Halobaculum saliterrae TaxID=2073113 RepID=A0A6B0T249_9EURY|nr:FlaD/FlaE family flagellar protein [Halobaculum saliterrae]MXR42883.1 flagella accessory C family protein [Halobaculum saliterrae]
MGLLTALSGAGVGGIPGADATLLVSLGLLGASLLDRFRDGDDGPGDVDDDGDDLLGGDDGAFGGGGGDGGGDDDLGDLGGMDDWDDDDPFGGEEGGGGDDGVAELEKRVDDLENEVASLSSTVNTVRSENEEISGKVEDMGEDVRSLLDIYEMVTRGINPFVDDVQGGGGGDFGGEGGFGLFDDADGEEESEEDLDEDLASADAEGFFDEDLADDGMDDLDEADEGDDLDDGLDEMEDDEFDDDLDGMDEGDSFDDDLDGFGDDNADDTDSDTMATDNGGGKSFSELKDEYESGDADWDEDGAEAAEPDGADGGADPLDALDAEPESNGHDEAGDLGMGGGAEPEPEPDPDPTPQSTAGPTDPSRRGAGVDDDGGFEFVEEDDLSDEPDKPYLTSLPGDYVGDLMVMEWLEFLVEESSTTDAVRAVNYYERVDWIDEEVADQLKGFLSGFGDIDRNLMDRPGTDHLDLDHHTRSLKYIMQLTDATAESVVIDRWPQLSGGMNGLQR